MTNVGFSHPVAKNFDKSAFGLPLMGASIYSHTFAGLGNYIGKKMDKKVEDAFRVRSACGSFSFFSSRALRCP